MMRSFTSALALVLALATTSNAAQADEDVVNAEDQEDQDVTDDGGIGSKAPAAPPEPAAPRADAAPRAAAPGSGRWWEEYRPMQESGLRAPLLAVGGGLTGLGVLTIVASGIVWLTAYGHSRDLDDECPNHECYEGTEGADTYRTTADLAKAAAITVGVGFPVMVTGVVLMGLGGSATQRNTALSVTPIIGTKQQGAALEVRF